MSEDLVVHYCFPSSDAGDAMSIGLLPSVNCYFVRSVNINSKLKIDQNKCSISVIIMNSRITPLPT